MTFPSSSKLIVNANPPLIRSCRFTVRMITILLFVVLLFSGKVFGELKQQQQPSLLHVHIQQQQKLKQSEQEQHQQQSKSEEKKPIISDSKKDTRDHPSLIKAHNVISNFFKDVFEVTDSTLKYYDYVFILFYYPWDGILDDLENELSAVSQYMYEAYDGEVNKYGNPLISVVRMRMDDHESNEQTLRNVHVTNSPSLILMKASSFEVISQYRSIKKSRYMIRFLEEMIKYIQQQTGKMNWFPIKLDRFEDYQNECQTKLETYFAKSDHLIYSEYMVIGMFPDVFNDMYLQYVDTLEELTRTQELNLHSSSCYFALINPNRIYSKDGKSRYTAEELSKNRKKFFAQVFDKDFHTGNILPQINVEDVNDILEKEDDQEDKSNISIPVLSDIIIYSQITKQCRRFRDGPSNLSKTELMNDWIRKNMEPAVQELTPINYNNMISSGKPLLIQFVNETNPDNIQPIYQHLIGIASQKYAKYSITYMDGVKFNTFYKRVFHTDLDYIETLPSTAIVDPVKAEHFICEDCIANTNENSAINRFIESYESGKLKRKIRSMEMSEPGGEYMKSPVPTVSYNSIHEMLYLKPKYQYVLTLFYTDHCIHCRNFMPLFEDIYRYLRNHFADSVLEIVRLNYRYNDIPRIVSSEMKGFPTVVLFKTTYRNQSSTKEHIGEDTFIKNGTASENHPPVHHFLYHGLRNFEELTKWCTKHIDISVELSTNAHQIVHGDN